MPKTKPSPRTENAIQSTSLPTLMVRMDDKSHGATVLFDRIGMKDILRDAVLSTYRWLFTPDTTPSCITSITVAAKTKGKSGASLQSASDVDCIVRDDEAFIYLSNDYIEAAQTMANDEAKEVVRRDIYSAVCCILNPQFDDESYPQKFFQGFSDYMMLKEGFPLISPSCYDGPTSEYLWYGRDMPYFLDWISETFGEDAILKLNTAFGEPYDKTVFETVTGTPISGLWKRYCSAVDKIGNEAEEMNANLSALWPVPELEHTCDWGLEHEGIDIFMNTINPLDALSEAVLATFEHLYTPKTVPTDVKKISLSVLQPRPMENPIEINDSAESCCELVISLDWIKANKPSARILMRLLVFCVSRYYHTLNSTGGYHSWSSKILGESMSVYVLMSEGLVTPYSGRQGQGEENADVRLFANFLYWIENTVYKGAVRKLNSLVSRYEYDPVWFEELTGKALEELCFEYKAMFPEAGMPEELQVLPVTP